ncbi:sensor histidine kinase [Pseudomarimonas salicorniae]|uniref:histidine kinase n=1 Tax=Pseudomarimonas salicorniae TaxID=2933270 RepID=A0ABT0GIN7_9GAMM|nr:sensor histidine kinase [Lysobacter sp. CAU 1642]MCK7594411.1 sensor histidine kinase [Lysobacter sp. CAU 1642]
MNPRARPDRSLPFPPPEACALDADPRFLALLERLPDPTLLLDGETVRYANPAARSQAGLPADDPHPELQLDALFDGASAQRVRQALDNGSKGDGWTALDRLRLRRLDETWISRDGELVAIPGASGPALMTLRAAVAEQSAPVVAAARRALAESSLRAVEAQERERARLSRELHDQIGQSLSAAALRLSLLLQRHAIPDDDPQAMALSSILDDVLQQTRSLSLQLRPPQLDDFGLASALRSLLQRLFADTGIHYDIEIEGSRDMPANRVSVAAYRIIQECLTNVLRHARAAALRVELRADSIGLVLTVVDDGAGFDAERVDSERLGLRGMRERAEALGGQLVVHSRAGIGTRVRAFLPWSPLHAASQTERA